MALDTYRGGGVLYYTRGPAGTVEILLALRKYNPNKNTWSIPGGGLERLDAGDLIRCAMRETREEGFGGHPNVEAALTAAQSRELMSPGIELRTHTPALLRLAHPARRTAAKARRLATADSGVQSCAMVQCEVSTATHTPRCQIRSEVLAVKVSPRNRPALQPHYTP